MDITAIVSLVATLIGAGLAVLSKFLYQRGERHTDDEVMIIDENEVSDATSAQETLHWVSRQIRRFSVRPGLAVLAVFSLFICAFGIVTFVYYWEVITQNVSLLLYAIWLFFAMVGGMFVQVLAANYRSGKPLSDVTASQLVFPVLFSLIVYYPIWALAASAPRNFFAVHAAFLNGYFWESVVSAARLPPASGE